MKIQNTYFDSWLDNFVTEQDIDSIASWGFNSVRLPMHYDLFTLIHRRRASRRMKTLGLDRGISIWLMSLLDWCESNRVILNFRSYTPHLVDKDMTNLSQIITQTIPLYGKVLRTKIKL